MGASSSCCFCIAKAEESPCTENDGVAELEMVGGRGRPLPGGRNIIYSPRWKAMMRSRGQFTDDVELEIEFSKLHWSEVSRLEVAPQSAEEKELNRENRELLKQLVEEYSTLFLRNLPGYILGRMIARGGQATIYELQGHPRRLMKGVSGRTNLVTETGGAAL